MSKLSPERFIKAIRLSFIGSEQVYREGSCCGLFRILKTVFPEAQPYWSTDARHCITKISGKFYDIGGEVKKPKGYKLSTDPTDTTSISVALPSNSEKQWERFTSSMPLSEWAEQSL